MPRLNQYFPNFVQYCCSNYTTKNLRSNLNYSMIRKEKKNPKRIKIWLT